jgi:hypothetical protein
MRLPEDGSGRFYRDAAVALDRASVSVHIFTPGPGPAELPALSVPSGLTSGGCNYYRDFGESHRARLHNDLFAVLTDSHCWDASLCFRCTPGVRLARAHANCILRSDQTALLPVVGRATTVAFDVGVAQPIGSAHAIVQGGFVHTDARGRRVIRVFTFAMPVVADAALLWASVDEGAMAAMLARRAATALLATGTAAAAQAIAHDVHRALASGAQLGSACHFLHALLAHAAVRPRGMANVDARMAALLEVRAIGVEKVLLFLYPRLMGLHGNHALLPLTRASLDSGSCFVFHTWRAIYVWVRRNAAEALLADGFGVREIDAIGQEIVNLETAMNREIHKMVQDCWNWVGMFVPVQILVEGRTPDDEIVAALLVDDSAACGADLRTWARAYGVQVD